MREEQTEILLADGANIFGTKDENDNAEAAKQMKVLTAISRESGVCIILCHHVGKSGHVNYGRGATTSLRLRMWGWSFAFGLIVRMQTMTSPEN